MDDGTREDGRKKKRRKETDDVPNEDGRKGKKRKMHQTNRRRKMERQI